MAERGATPDVPQWRLKAMNGLRGLFTPLVIDDYLELINPLWSTQELRGRILTVVGETADAATITIKPGWNWPGHEPGQYLRIGLVVDGIHHWRAYSLTSDPERDDGCISITPKYVEGGKVSGHLLRGAEPGTVVRLGGVEGTFTLPDPAPEKLLFVSAGSGVTPIMSMVRALAHRSGLRDAVMLHSARTPDDVIFGADLRRLAARHEGFRLHEQHTAEHGRLGPEDLDRLVPDWRERELYLSGPEAMLDAFTAHVEEHGDGARLHMEHFQPPKVVGDAEHGAGGTIALAKSKVEATSDGATPILVAAEDAGATLPYGCRMGICHTCVGRLESGQVRDLRTGKVSGTPGEMIRTCVNAPEGAVEIAL